MSRIKPLAKSTSRPGCEVDLGLFGGMFDVKASGYKDPILVSGTDGVGTKLKVGRLYKPSNTPLIWSCPDVIRLHSNDDIITKIMRRGRIGAGVV